MNKPVGIIRIKIGTEDVDIQFNGSVDAFKRFSIALLEPIINMTEGYCFKEAMYFDEGLTDEELKTLTKI